MRIAQVGLAALIISVAWPESAYSQTPAPTFGVPNNNPQAPMTSPIQVEDCKTPYVGGLLLAETIEKFTIVFTNEGSVTADLVRFEIHLGQEDIFIRDVGKFEPGITVTHVFRKRGGNVVTSPLFAPAPFYCGVASAHFIDGTDWTPSSPPNVSSTALLPAPAQTPLPLSGNGYIGLVLQQTDAGVVVHLVLPGAPAEQAGIHQGDLIFQIDRQRAATVADAITLISATPPGTKLSIMVIRDGTQQTLNAIVAARPPTAQGP